MLLDIKIPYTDCNYCGSKKLIYGYSMFHDEENMKVECECKSCGRIFFKILNENEYEIVRKERQDG